MKWTKISRGIISFLFISLTSYGQRNETAIHFSPKPIYFEDSLFDRVIVVDNRFDTSSIVNITQGKNGIIVAKWDTPLKTAIQTYIQTLMGSPASTRERYLLIELRRYEANSNGMHFSANAYYGAGDNVFIKLVSMDTIFPRRWEHYLTGGGINDLLQKIMQRRYPDQVNPDTAVAISAIRSNNVMREWGSLPINTAENYPPGVYEGYTTFRKNQPMEYALTVEKKEDSVYVVTFTDTLPEKRKRIIAWLNVRGRGVISYQGQLYYLLAYPVCLPLIRKGNTFYFHIPSSLPNMYFLNQARAEGLGMTSWSDLTPIRNAAGGVVAATAIVLGTFARTAQTKALWKEGLKDPTLRDCYIDLGTGIIHYY